MFHKLQEIFKIQNFRKVTGYQTFHILSLNKHTHTHTVLRKYRIRGFNLLCHKRLETLLVFRYLAKGKHDAYAIAGVW